MICRFILQSLTVKLRFRAVDLLRCHTHQSSNSYTANKHCGQLTEEVELVPESPCWPGQGVLAEECLCPGRAGGCSWKGRELLASVSNSIQSVLALQHGLPEVHAVTSTQKVN